MTLKSAFAHFTSKHSKAPSAVENLSLSAWRSETVRKPTRQVERVQFCSAKTSGTNERGQSLHDYDTHTFLRASVAPTTKHPEEEVFIERIIAFKGTSHSVAPSPDTESTCDIFPLEFLDRAFIVPQGSSAVVIPQFEVERTLEFHFDMSVQELATILEFVSETTKLVDAGFGCADLSRSFAFTCLASLAPALPPSPKTCSRNSHAQGVAEACHEAMLEGDAKRFVDQYLYMPRGTQTAPTLWLIHSKRGGQLRLRTPASTDLDQV